jgi:hypothetical protein
MTKPLLTDRVIQLEHVVREQMAEIDRLRAIIDQKDAEIVGLVDWIAGEKDALSALQAAYTDPRSTPTNKIRAAASAIAYERSKPASVTVIADFRSRVQAARSRTLELRKQEWTQQAPLDLDAPTPPTILGGDHEGEALGPEPAA